MKPQLCFFSKKLSGYYMYCADDPCLAIIEFLD